MIEMSDNPLKDIKPAIPYRAHTVEILLTTAAVLVAFMAVYLVFFDGKTGY